MFPGNKKSTDFFLFWETKTNSYSSPLYFNSPALKYITYEDKLALKKSDSVTLRWEKSDVDALLLMRGSLNFLHSAEERIEMLLNEGADSEAIFNVDLDDVEDETFTTEVLPCKKKFMFKNNCHLLSVSENLSVQGTSTSLPMNSSNLQECQLGPSHASKSSAKRFNSAVSESSSGTPKSRKVTPNFKNQLHVETNSEISKLRILRESNRGSPEDRTNYSVSQTPNAELGEYQNNKLAILRDQLVESRKQTRLLKGILLELRFKEGVVVADVNEECEAYDGTHFNIRDIVTTSRNKFAIAFVDKRMGADYIRQHIFNPAGNSLREGVPETFIAEIKGVLRKRFGDLTEWKQVLESLNQAGRDRKRNLRL